MVIVAPFREVVCEFEAGDIGGSVFEVDDDELLVFVFGMQEGRLLVVGAGAENVAVLGLRDGM